MNQKNNDKKSNNEDWWNVYVKQMNADKTLAIHSGYFEKGIKTHEEAIINKNKVIEKLLNLEKLGKKKSIILDAGCGVGGTCIFLAKNYSHIKFLGLNVSPIQIKLAPKFAKQSQVSSNTDFILGDFLEIGLKDKSIDGIFAIESITRANDIKRFLVEASRILKLNGKIVIDDAFIFKKPSNYFTKLVYNAYCKTWKIPSMESFEIFKTNLEELKFNDIKIKEITKNTWLSFFIINLKFLIYSIFSNPGQKIEMTEKNTMNEKSSILTNSFIHTFLMFSTSIILILNRNVRKVVITAVKKE